MKFLYLFGFIIMFITSCSSENNREEEMEDFLQSWREREQNKLEEVATLLALKHEKSPACIKEILVEYIRNSDNYSYQLITTDTLDVKEWHKFIENEEYISLDEAIKASAKSFFLPEKTIAGILMDYRFLEYQERIEYLDSRYDELEYIVENYYDQ